MPRFSIQLLAVTLLIIAVWIVHEGSSAIVAQGLGWGIATLVLAIISLPFLSRYLD